MLIAGFMPTSFVDWRGKVVSTKFTYGCNFRCPFCHNYTLVTEKVDKFIDKEEIIERVEDIKEWIDGICITGGEPTIHGDLPEFIKELRKIKPVKLDSNGSNPEVLREAIKYVDYVAMDIKAPKALYDKLSGVKVDINAINESINIIKRYAKDYEFRTTAVPILKFEDFLEIARWLKRAKRYVIQQYSTLGGTLNSEFSKLPSLKPEVLKDICKEIKGNFQECLVANI
jgi:pyruvate formate lyase activating enzyme